MKRSFYTRYGFMILVVVVFLIPLVLSGTRRALKSNTNDVKQWLPSNYEETKVFQRFRQQFAGEEFVLVSWEGCTLDDDRLQILVAKLIPPPPVGDKDAPEAYFTTAETGVTLLDRLISAPTSLPYDVAIDRLRGSLIGPDGITTCAVLTMSDAGKLHRHEAIDQIYQVAEEECAIPRADLKMGGPPVDNVSIDIAGEESLFRLAGMAGLIGVGISWWCLRSVKLIIIVFFTALYAAGLSLAVVKYTGGTMNAILLTMPPLVYVAATSGAIHLANYYRDTVLERGLDGAPERAVKHAMLPLSLATITTAVGLFSLCYSELLPIQLFGLYSGIGVIMTMVLLLTYTPSALQLFPLTGLVEKKQSEEPPLLPDPMASPKWRAIGEFILRRHWQVNLACLALMGVCVYGVTQIKTSVHLMRLFDSKARILADYKWLEGHLGRLVPMEVVLEVEKEPGEGKRPLTFFDQMKLVERVQGEIKTLDLVGGALSSVTFAPELPTFKVYANGRMSGMDVGKKGTWNRRLINHKQEFIDGDYLRETDTHYIWRISARVGALEDVNYGAFVEDIKLKVEPELAKIRGDDPDSIKAVYTGLVPLVYKAQTSLLDGLIFGFVMDVIIVTIVMMIAVRDWSSGLVLCLPSVFPSALIFGVMGWLGIVVDVGTVMAPAVALGVTVDDVVHFMIWYRNGLKQGLSRKDSIMLAYKGCARAMYQSWGVIGLGLAVFAMSPFQPTQRFGYLMVTLLTAALIGNLLLLPTLLAGPMGLLFGRKLRLQAAARLAAEAAAEAESEDSDASPAGEIDRADVIPLPIREERPKRSAKA